MNIKEFKKDYFVGEDGSIYKKLKPQKCSNGYMDFKDNDKKHHLVHRLVAEQFLGTDDLTLDVNHKDGNRQNNNVSNLEWCTRSENLIHSFNELGQTPIRFFKECNLFYNGEFVKQFGTMREASRYAEQKGAKYSMLEKHRKHNGWEIRCIDYPVGE